MSQYLVVCRRPFNEAVYGQPTADPVPCSPDPEDGLVDRPFDSLDSAKAFAAGLDDPAVIVVQVC